MGWCRAIRFSLAQNLGQNVATFRLKRRINFGNLVIRLIFAILNWTFVTGANMNISEMLNSLIRLGHVLQLSGRSAAAPLGSYREVPSITIYGNPAGSSIMTGIADAKLEQYPAGNFPGAGTR
jgi:hypothetical protein